MKTFEGLLTTPQFLIILAVIVLLGGILFFISCFIKVKKGTVAIIEKVNEFEKIYEPGLYLFAPFTHRRAGMYKVGETTSTYMIGRDKYKVTYEIVDVKKYHYSGHDLEGIIKASLKDSKDNLSEAIIRRTENVGIRFIKLEKIKAK